MNGTIALVLGSYFAAVLASEVAIREGHVMIMCDSTVYFQTFTSPASNTRPPLTANTDPMWLAQSASASVCYADALTSAPALSMAL
jgi:hypothetical protein